MPGIMFTEMFHEGQPMLKVLPELLKDQTTGKNIVWATDTYSSHGSKYKKNMQIFTGTCGRWMDLRIRFLSEFPRMSLSS